MTAGPACPSCGIAVLPGYVRCPKCHAALPKQRLRTQAGPGGTAVPRAGRPIVPIAIGVVAIAVVVIAVIASRRHGSASAAPEQTAAPAEPTPSAAPTKTAPTSALASDTAPSGPSAGALAANLDRALKRERLWSTVGVVGDRLDIRSSSCADPGLARIVDDARAQLVAAGVHEVRCAEVNGKVVFDHGL